VRELTIHHLPGVGKRRAQVRVSYRSREGAQPQERVTPFGFRIDDEQRRLVQWYLEQYLVFPWGEFRERAQRVETLLQQLGAELFESTFGNRETAALYEHVADDLANTRIAVHAATPEGIGLPWELLRDPRRGTYGQLATGAHSFIRSQSDLVFEPPPPSTGETFNILLVICRPVDGEDLPFQSEARRLLELVRRHRDQVRLDVLRPPTFDQLAKVLGEKPGQYQAVHFDGHGRFLEAAQGQGVLAFEEEDGRTRRVTGDELGRLVAGKGVPLVVLSACQSGMTRPEALFPSIGNQLLMAGVGGVVAMTHAIQLQGALRFMARLYEGLMQGEELARAVTLGREALRAGPYRFSPIGEVPLQDWIVPVVFESAPVQVLKAPLAGLQLEPGVLHDQQARAGRELGCPEPPDYGFVGRDETLLQLERVLRQESIVLLRGMAGVGKTEAALGFGRWWAETGALAGPIFFFSFEHHLPLSRVCDEVGQVFQGLLKKSTGVEWSQLTAAVRRQLALMVLTQMPCLMIWDNFETVAGFPVGSKSDWTPEERQELRDFLNALRGGATHVLLTSRRQEPWLGNIYAHAQVDGLTLAESQELAVRVLVRVGQSAPQIAALPQYNDLLRYLQGNPLAIQLIVPELVRRKPAELLEALRTGEVQLSADNPAMGRDGPLSASISYRLDTLDPELRQLVGLLSLFQGFVDAWVLGELCTLPDALPVMQGRDREFWLPRLTTIAELGLLRRLGPSSVFAMHPVAPWFLRDLLESTFQADLEWLKRAFARTYGNHGRYVAGLFKSGADVIMSVLLSEEANLRTALRMARDYSDWDAMVGIMRGLGSFLRTQGRWVEWERVVSDAELDAMDVSGNPQSGRESLWLEVLQDRADIAAYRGLRQQQDEALRKLYEYFNRNGDEARLLHIALDLGVLAFEQHKFADSERWHRQSLESARRLGDQSAEAAALHEVAMVAQQLGRPEEAEALYLQSLAIQERLGDLQSQAGSLHQLGVLAQLQQHWDEAEQFHTRSLDIAGQIHFTSGQTMALHELGMVAQSREEWDKAEDLHRRALVTQEATGDQAGRIKTLLLLGHLAQQRGQWDEASGWLSAAYDGAQRTGDPYQQLLCCDSLGSLAYTRQRFEEAEQWYGYYLAIADSLGDVHTQALAHLKLGTVRFQSGDQAGALQHFQQSAAQFAEVNDAEGVAAAQRAALMLVAADQATST